MIHGTLTIMDVVIPVLLLSFIGSIAGLLGGIILLLRQSWGRLVSVYAVAFAAGVLLTVSLTDLLPEAIESLEAGKALGIVLGVFVVASLLEKLIVHFHHHEDHGHDNLDSAVGFILVGDAMHNFLDGVSIAASFIADTRLGVFVALATFLHELPQEIGDFGLLLAAGWKRWKIITFNLITAATTFIGALGTLFFAPRIEGSIPFLLAVAAGLFLYIATTDLLPRAGLKRKGSTWRHYGLFVIGVMLMIAVGILVSE